MPVRDMPRHKLEVIKLLITAKEPVKTVIYNAFWHFPNLRHQGPSYTINQTTKKLSKNFE